LPNLALIEYAQLPILLIVITMPIIATLPEFRPKIDWKRRCMEFILLISTFPLMLFLSGTIPASLIVIIAIIPLLIQFKHSVDEEE